ncbi:MAG TPA: hypothetical protein VHU15_10965 [Stellaceae bacterium]|jgi:hypothetical protein|nr:hypothetical protein [Stellaceae bacterium]
MSDQNFFANSARECRRLARNAASEHVRWQLLLWAREFDAIAVDGRPQHRAGPQFKRFADLESHLEAAD